MLDNSCLLEDASCLKNILIISVTPHEYRIMSNENDYREKCCKVPTCSTFPFSSYKQDL